MQNNTPAEAHAFLEKNPTAMLVDVREPAEIAELSVPGAKLIPLGELPNRLSELAGYTDIFFMCKSGGRSARATALAEAAGIANVHNIEGGITAWELAGLPTHRGESK